MINELESVLPAVIVKLHESDFIFYSTGDRYFKTPATNPVARFFVQSQSNLAAFLKSLGFKVCLADMDHEIIEVYRYTSLEDDGEVLIEIVRDVGLKLRAREILKRSRDFSQTLNTTARILAWNVVLETLRTLDKKDEEHF